MIDHSSNVIMSGMDARGMRPVTVRSRSTRDEALFRALAHPLRREILETILVEHAADSSGVRVTGLADVLEVHRVTLSHHLRILRSAGLVHEVVLGTVRMQRLDFEGFAALMAWVDQFTRAVPRRT